MSRNPNITLVTFDLDNTLWSVRQVIGNAEKQMRAYLAERVPAFNEHFTRESLWKTREALLPRYPEIRHDLTRMRELVLRQALLDFGLADAEASTVAQVATEAFLEGRHAVEFFPHALTTLAELSQHYTLAALSNGNANIARLGLDRFFAFSCSAADVGASKPAPPMFERAMAAGGGQAPQPPSMWAIIRSTIFQGAAEVGMHTVLVELKDVEPHPGAMDQDGSAASARITCLSELPATLRGL